MTKTAFTFFFLFATIACLWAQDGAITFPLQKFRTKTLVNNYALAEVIDVRNNKDVLGVLIQTRHNKVVVFEDDFEKTITSLLEKSFTPQDIAVAKNDIAAAKKKLAIRINNLWVYQVKLPDGYYRAIAELDISFFEKKEDGNYIELFSTSQLQNEPYGTQVLTMELQNMAKNFENALIAFTKAAATGRLSNKTVSKQDLLENPLNFPEKFPIFQQKTLKKGIYYSNQQLKNNHPDTATAFVLNPVYYYNNSKGKIDYYQIRTPKHKTIRNVVAASDGENLYVAEDAIDEMHKLERDSLPRFVRDIEVVKGSGNRDAAGMIISSVLGGLIGVGIYMILTDKEDSDPLKPKNYKVPCEYDVTTGMLRPVGITRFDTEIMFINPRGGKELPIDLVIDGKKVATLPSHSYYIYKTKPQKEPLNICFSINNVAQCQTSTVYYGESNGFIYNTKEEMRHLRFVLTKIDDTDGSYTYTAQKGTFGEEYIFIKKEYTEVK